MAIKDDLKVAEAALNNAKTLRAETLEKLAQNPSPAQRKVLRTTFDAQEANIKRLEKVVGPLRKQLDKEKKAAAAVETEGKLDQEKADLGLLTRKKTLDAAAKSYSKDPSDDIKYATYQKALKDVYDYEQKVLGDGLKVVFSVETIAGGYAPVATTKPAPVATTKPAPVATTKPAPVATTKPAPVVVPGSVRDAGAAGGGAGVVLGTPDGGGGGGGGGGSGATGKPPQEPTKPPVVPGSILDELATKFPAFADWSEAQATAYFGSDLIKVFNEIAKGTYGVGKDKSIEAIQRDIEGTGYWKTTIAATKTWDQLGKPDQTKRITDQKALLVQSFGELQLDDAALTDLATTIQRTGLTELGAKQLVYGAAFTRPVTPTGPQSRQLALESEQADQLRKIARAYGYSPLDIDDQIQSILTGKSYLGGAVLTAESFREKAEKSARGSFAHLKDQFDSGLTLDDMFGNYRDIAARVLEVDPGTVDFMKDPQKWLKPFGDAKSGQMSLSDWVRELKTNQDYNWRFTNQANQQVSSVVSTLEKAFGFRK